MSSQAGLTPSDHFGYGIRAAAKSVAGFDRPNMCRRNSADNHQAFFYAWRFLYGDQRGEAFWPAGVLYYRSVNPALAATLFRLTADVAAPTSSTGDRHA